MAGVAGLEPVTSAVTGQRSNQLSYTPANGEPGRYETHPRKSSVGPPPSARRRRAQLRRPDVCLLARGCGWEY